MSKTAYAEVCRGSGCRKHKTRIQKLMQTLDGECEVGRTKCLDLCKGPVVCVTRDNTRHLFSKLRGDKLREDLRHFVRTGRLSKQLKKRRKKKLKQR